MPTKFRALTALLISLMLLTTACRPNGAQVSSGPVVSEPEIARPPVTLLYPDALPEGAAESAAYREAVERQMLICGGEQPATDAALVEWFLGEVQAGRPAELLIAVFVAHEREEAGFATVTRFENRADGLYMNDAYLPSWDDSTVPFGPEAWEIRELYLNDYGCLIYNLPGTSDPSGLKVLHDRAIYPNHDAANAIYETYLRPILYTALGGDEWRSPAALSQWVGLYEDLSNYEGVNPFDRYGSNWPVEGMLSTLNRYFEGITREHLSLGSYGYDAATDTIHYEGGRGGGPKPMRVLDWTEKDGLLEIRYVGYDYTTHMPYNDDYLLTVRKMSDGSFRYLTNTYAPYVNRLARDVFLDPGQLRPEQNSFFPLDDAPDDRMGAALSYGARHVQVDGLLPAPLNGYLYYPGSFVTNPKTALAFGGTPEETGELPLTVMISEDMGATWTSAEIFGHHDPEMSWPHKQIGFTTLDSGWLLLLGADRSGVEHARLYTTSDGGTRWNPQTLPSQEMPTSFGFVSPEVGFFSCRGEDSSGPPLWRTTDGGQSWQRLTLPLQEGLTAESAYISALRYTRNRVELTVVLEVAGVQREWAYTSWDNGESWQFPVRLPSFDTGLYSAVSVTKDGRTQEITHPYERQEVKLALSDLMAQNCLATGTDPEALLPGYAALPQRAYQLTGPEAQWRVRLHFGENQGLIAQEGDTPRYYLVEQYCLDAFLRECGAAKGKAIEREAASAPGDYDDPAFRQQALAMGYSEAYLDDLKETGGMAVDTLLAMDAEGVSALLSDFSATRAFIDSRLAMGWDRLGTATGESPAFMPDGNKGVFFCYDPDEYYSPAYMIWCDRQTGETKYLGMTYYLEWALDTARGLLVVSSFSDLEAFDMNTGNALPTVYAFDFGHRLAGGEPERVVRGLGYDGFADRFVVFYTDNDHGEWLRQKLMLAVFEGGGQHLRDVDTGVVITAIYKNFPVVASFVSFTADGYIHSDFAWAGPLNIKY